MRKMRTNSNVYKQKIPNSVMSKKEVTISLDEEILECIDKIQKENLNAKRSTIINEFLKNNPEIKKRLKKK